MDPLSAAGLALGVAGLAVQVYEGCIQAIQLIITAMDMPEKCKYLDLRLRMEQQRLFAWSETAGLMDLHDSGSSAKILESNTFVVNRTLVLDLLVQVQYLFTEFRELQRENKYLAPAAASPTAAADAAAAAAAAGGQTLGGKGQPSRPSPAPAPAPAPPPAQPQQGQGGGQKAAMPQPGGTSLDEALLRPDEDARLANVPLPPRRRDFIKRAMTKLRAASGDAALRLRWVSFDEREFEKLLGRFEALNDAMSDMLDARLQREIHATVQDTNRGVLQLHRKIHDLHRLVTAFDTKLGALEGQERRVRAAEAVAARWANPAASLGLGGVSVGSRDQRQADAAGLKLLSQLARFKAYNEVIGEADASSSSDEDGQGQRHRRSKTPWDDAAAMNLQLGSRDRAEGLQIPRRAVRVKGIDYALPAAASEGGHTLLESSSSANNRSEGQILRLGKWQQVWIEWKDYDTLDSPPPAQTTSADDHQLGPSQSSSSLRRVSAGPPPPTGPTRADVLHRVKMLVALLSHGSKPEAFRTPQCLGFFDLAEGKGGKGGGGKGDRARTTAAAAGGRRRHRRGKKGRSGRADGDSHDDDDHHAGGEADADDDADDADTDDDEGGVVDIRDMRLGLVFARPDGADAHGSGRIHPTAAPVSLRELFDEDRRGMPLSSSSSAQFFRRRTPRVTDRVALARAVASCLLHLHAVNWLHKGLRSRNVIFFRGAGGTGPASTPDQPGEIDYGRPYLTGFDYSRPARRDEYTVPPPADDDVEADLYRHPRAQVTGGGGAGLPYRASSSSTSLNSLAVPGSPANNSSPAAAAAVRRKSAKFSPGPAPRTSAAELLSPPGTPSGASSRGGRTLGARPDLQQPPLQQRSRFRRSFDVYALGVVLVEIAHWAPVDEVLRLRGPSASAGLGLAFHGGGGGAMGAGMGAGAMQSAVARVRDSLLQDEAMAEVGARMGAVYEGATRRCLLGGAALGISRDDGGEGDAAGGGGEDGADDDGEVDEEVDDAVAARMAMAFYDDVIKKLAEVRV